MSYNSMNVLLGCFYTFSEISFYFVERPDQNRKSVTEYFDTNYALSGISELLLPVVIIPLYIVTVWRLT
jgi:hypothetical protein